MSANDNFGKNPADETDIDQLVRVMKELENAFRKVSLISDQLSQVTFRDMFKISLDFMKLEKQRYQDAKKHAYDMSKIDQKTKDRITIINAQNKSDKMIMKQRSLDATQRAKERSELLTQHDLMVRSHILLRNRMKNSTNQLDFFVTSLTKGLSIGDVGGQLQKVLVNMYNITDDVVKLEKQKTDAEKKLLLIIDQQSDAYKKLKKEIEDFNEQIKNAKNNSQGSTAYKMMGGQQGKMATTLRALGEFAKTHKTGIVLGTVAGGLLLYAIKKAIDVSPVFQNVLKLLEFGFMLILRPIGDFFGFVFRPIMIMMLRNFILPFFRYVYPFFRDWGTKIGEFLTTDLGAFILLFGTGGAIFVMWAFWTTLFTQIRDCVCKDCNKGGGSNPPIAIPPTGGTPTGTGIPIKTADPINNPPASNNGMIVNSPHSWSKTVVPNPFTGLENIVKSADKFFTGDIALKNPTDIWRKEAEKIIDTGFHIDKKPEIILDEVTPTQKNNQIDLNKLKDITKIENPIGNANWFDWMTDIPNMIPHIIPSIPFTNPFQQNPITIGNDGKPIPDDKLNKNFSNNGKLHTNNNNIGKDVTGFGGNKFTNNNLGTTTPLKGFGIASIGAIGAELIGSLLGTKNNNENSLFAQLVGDQVYTDLKSIEKSLEQIGQPVINGKDETLIDQYLINPLKNLFGTQTIRETDSGIVKYAHGGMITEPIHGIGKSGQHYLLGERGAEMVTPMSKISTSNSDQKVIINVYGDVTDKAMAEFERKVLQVLKNSNSRRGM